MTKCLFSGEDAKYVTLDGYDGYAVTTTYGEYWITGGALSSYSGSNALPKLAQFNCLRETILLQREGLIPFWTPNGTGTPPKAANVVLRSIESEKNRPLNHKDKDKRILELFSRKLAKAINPFEFTFLDAGDRYSIGIFDLNEYEKWIRYLVETNQLSTTAHLQALLEQPRLHAELYPTLTSRASIGLTVQGWETVRSLGSGLASKKAFIAMAFTDKAGKELNAELRDVIKKALSEIGWEPVIVNEVEHNDGIMDKVVASINEARFVVAELTHHKSGVYYESGYAKGKGLPVVHLVNESDFKDCHFDVRHLNLIVWNDHTSLSEKLKNRVRATITRNE